MGDKELVNEYRYRYGRSRLSRYCAILVAVGSTFYYLLASSDAPAGQSPFQQPGLGYFGILLLLCLTLLAISILLNKCPNCERVLGGFGDYSFCPGCDALLRPGAHASAGERVFRRRPFVEEENYPEEKYPKKAGLFADSDELQLTRRYARLIRRDDEAAPDSEVRAPRNWRNFFRRPDLTPKKGTPGDYLHRDVGLTALFVMVLMVAVFFFQIVFGLDRKIAASLILFGIILGCLRGVWAFLAQSGDWHD
jgi:hypothetical protein